MFEDIYPQEEEINEAVKKHLNVDEEIIIDDSLNKKPANPKKYPSHKAKETMKRALVIRRYVKEKQRERERAKK
jgi:hypothetical protein